MIKNKNARHPELINTITKRIHGNKCAIQREGGRERDRDRGRENESEREREKEREREREREVLDVKSPARAAEFEWIFFFGE